MYVLFCASADLKDAKYIRKGNKNLLETKFGICDTVAMCGRVVDCSRTKFGVMLTLNDGKNFVITAGTFNKNALHDAEDVLQKFRENKEIYLLIYANPFHKDAIYLNANQDYSVIEVTKKIYEKFHEMRKKGQAYLMEKFNKDITEKEKEEEEKEEKETIEEYEGYGIDEGIEPLMSELKKQQEINLKIVQFIENLAKKEKNNIIGIEEVVNKLAKSEFSYLNINWTDKIYELLEMGYFYEPMPGYIKPIT